MSISYLSVSTLSQGTGG